MEILDQIIRNEIALNELSGTKIESEKKRHDLIKNGKIKKTWIFGIKYNSNSNKIQKLKGKINRITNKIEEGVYEQNQLVYSYLIMNDSVFKKNYRKNLLLLRDTKIVFKNSKTRYNAIASYTSAYKGSLGNDGLIRCEATKISSGILPYSKNEFPLSFSGSINALGCINLEVKEIGFEILGGRLPDIFSGYITEQGSVHITTESSSIEFHGSQYVNSLVGKIHFNNLNDENLFMLNAQELGSCILKFRNELKL
jgi:hypothetical protein